TKKIIKSLLYSKQNILKNLRMYLSKKRQSLFINLKHFLLGYAAKSVASSLVMVSSIQKAGVMQDAAHIQSPLKPLRLLPGRIKAIFIGFGFQHIFLRSSNVTCPVDLRKYEGLQRCPPQSFFFTSGNSRNISLAEADFRLATNLDNWI
ncbi:hypothetical protein HKBW3S43_02000, partial [Candidatus Hakubella thermalkaliphila]